ncbi:MAG: ABC transporter permease [Lachnospiraceae bacterium]|nr:ABC transporter permease [Lachnospiraceae bacterium]MBP1584839.1 ABC transporter permease [Lachnospiraceae bacterium]
MKEFTAEFLNRFFPNIVELQRYLYTSIKETAIMIVITGAIGLTLGLFFGIVLVTTGKGGLYENLRFHNILEKIVNIVRSIPFVILIALLVTFTRFLVGTAIGVKGAIVPMVIGIIPLGSRLTEQALSEMDKGVMEAALAMGISKPYIIFHVLIPESLPGLIRALVTCFISLIGLTAMAGSVGGGGVGSFAIRYGYNRYMTDVTIVCVLFLLILVSIVQGIGNRAVSKLTH